MKINPTKKLLKKLDKIIPGSSEYIFDQTRTKLNKKDRTKLDFASGIYEWLSENDKSKPAKRKPFSKLNQEKAIENQKNRCKDCRKKSDVFEFHHADGDRPQGGSLRLFPRSRHSSAQPGFTDAVRRDCRVGQRRGQAPG